jgi:hypothetical protein
MPQFDPHNPVLVPLDKAMPRIGNAWLAQYRGSGFISRMIQYGTGGPHSHTAMLRKPDGTDYVDVLELREFIGGRAVTLESQVAKYPGRIDVFSPDVKRFPEFSPSLAAFTMRRLTSRPYGYLGCLRLALRKVPLLWRLWPLDVSDLRELPEKTGAPFCSQALCTAYREGGRVDPVPRKPDDLVTPNDLTWSLLFKYEFTLIP